MVTWEWMTRRYRFPCPRREKYERGERERERLAVYPESAFSDSCTNGETKRDVKLAPLMIPKWCENIRRVHATRVKRKFCECVFVFFSGGRGWRGGIQDASEMGGRISKRLQRVRGKIVVSFQMTITREIRKNPSFRPSSPSLYIRKIFNIIFLLS